MWSESGAAELVGGDSELEVVTSALRAYRPVLVVGEPGIGKTALLRAAARASSRRVYEGGALGLLSDVPLLGVRRALRRQLPPGDGEALAEFAEVIVGDGVLILDDLQWADACTREVATLVSGRVRLLAGTRGEPVLDGFDVVRLHALDQRSAAALVRRQAPELPDADVRRVVAQAAGSPLLLGIGLTSAQIASRLGIERSTVETDVRSAMRKLGSRTRLQAAAARP
jgi:hypothetical protein